jgi:hypothetical protein
VTAENYCVGDDGLPHTYYRACSPLSGFCPATAAP